MPTVTIKGTYYNSNTNPTKWPESNWLRLQMAHSENTPKAIPDTASPGTFNLQITQVDGEPSTQWVPPNDDDYRSIAHSEGTNKGNAFSNGSDFMYKGNYIHPDIIVQTINEKPITNGLLYYAGSSNSFTSPNNAGTIDRHTIEIIADEKITEEVAENIQPGEEVVIALAYGEGGGGKGG